MAKLLLVEDDKNLREIYGTRLTAEGYTIVTAGDGEEALALAIKEKPNLIISDVMMPKISGFDMLDILRSTSETRDVKVIMMTALSSEDQRKRGESLGADRYLVKSQVGIEDVVRTVHEVMGDGTSTTSEPEMVQQSQVITEPEPPQPTVQPIVQPPVQQPVTPQPVVPPAPTPQAPAPLPNNAPTLQPVLRTATAPMSSPRPDITPVRRPTAPQTASSIPTPVINPASPSQPTAPSFTPEIPPAPAPIANPSVEIQPEADTSSAPVIPQPTPPATATFAPQPVQLPQPTAPFSTPRPRNLGDRIIQPIVPAPQSSGVSISDQMNATLGNTSPATPPPTTDVPPVAPASQLPGIPSQQQIAVDPAATAPTTNPFPSGQPSGLNFEEIPRNDQQPPVAI